MRIRMGMEGLLARECLLTIRNAGTSITIQRQGESMMQKPPMQLLREEQCVVKF